MIIFLYGPDTFRSQQKLNEIIENYKKIHKSGLSFYRLDLAEKNFRDFEEKIESTSMFKEKKLIVLENLFSNQDFVEKFLKYLEKSNLSQNQEEIVIIKEKENLSERNLLGLAEELFEKLKKISQYQEFKLLDDSRLKNWVEKEISLRGAVITPEALAKLIFYVGNDLWRMNNEINKLISFKSKNRNEKVKIENVDVELLVKPKIEADIFKTIEAFANKNKKLSFRLIHKHLERGESENYLLSMIGWQIRNLIKVKTYELGGKFNENRQIVPKLSKELKMHPYVAQKSLQQAKKFSLEELKKIYRKLLEVDYRIKTGKTEPKIALDLLIAEILPSIKY